MPVDSLLGLFVSVLSESRLTPHVWQSTWTRERRGLLLKQSASANASSVNLAVSRIGRVEGRRGSFRSRGVAVAGGFRHNAGASILTMSPFPAPAHRTGRAVFPHPALGPGSFCRHARCHCSRLAFRHSFRCSVWIFSGVARLIVNRLDPVLLRPHPGTRAPSLHRNYPASSVLRAPPPPAPARRLMLLLATQTWPPKRASRVPRCSLLTCRHPPPRRSGPNSSPGVLRSVPGFPQSRQGRPSHRVFRGRLGVHSRYGLPACRQPEAAFFLPGFDRFVASTASGIATRPGRPLPGQDFHLLEQ